MEGPQPRGRRLLGLDVDLSAFHRSAGRDPRIRPLAKRFLGFTPPRFSSLFECLVNALACQQLSLLVGIRLLNRIAEAYGPALPQGGSRVYGFPQPEALAAAAPEKLRSLGGLRRPVKDSVNGAWRNPSFRGFADYMQTEAFTEAFEGLVALATSATPVLMCAEAVPWRCH